MIAEVETVILVVLVGIHGVTQKMQRLNLSSSHSKAAVVKWAADISINQNARTAGIDVGVVKVIVAIKNQESNSEITDIQIKAVQSMITEGKGMGMLAIEVVNQRSLETGVIGMLLHLYQKVIAKDCTGPNDDVDKANKLQAQ
ncbi:hypothetical protein BDZ97DRAFT_1767575 [Flammula alnicola]|nr:hypothetical protein BDZ97DRAFT_1767575 [Flammula alnicola]